MLHGLTRPDEDKIIGVMRAFAADPRPHKIDLGAGIYHDAAGRAPVMAAVKEAERQLLEAQATKTYVGFSGDAAFRDVARAQTLGASVPADRVAAAAAVGGTGAVRLALELVRRAAPEASVWVSEPSWPNHPIVVEAVGLAYRPYRYVARETAGLDRDGMFADLAQMRAGDVLVLHGCCHNPSGVDPSLADWTALADLCVARGVVPLVDIAYQGFGAGFEEDAAGLQSMAERVPEMLVCVSGSKTYALYRERVGALLAIVSDPGRRDIISAILAELNRESISFPPDHGARVVTMIHTDPALRAMWKEELGQMRQRLVAMRVALAEALRDETGSDRLGSLAAQAGMFSLLPATREQMARLRSEHAVYAVENGRINLAGLTRDNVGAAARAIAAVLR